MKIRPLVIFGGAYGLSEALGLVEDINGVMERYRVLAALDDNPKLHGTIRDGVEIRGPLESFVDYPGADFVYMIGSMANQMNRLDPHARIGVAADRFITLIHPRATVYRTAELGRGCIVHAGAVIAGNVKFADFGIVAFNSVLGPDCIIGRGAMITTNVTVLTGAVIGACSFVGAGSCVAERKKIGPGAMVGMGSRVLHDVPPGAFALGDPARVLYTHNVPSSLMEGWI